MLILLLNKGVINLSENTSQQHPRGEDRGVYIRPKTHRIGLSID